MLCNTGHRELSERLSGVKSDFFLFSSLSITTFGVWIFGFPRGNGCEVSVSYCVPWETHRSKGDFDISLQTASLDKHDRKFI